MDYKICPDCKASFSCGVNQQQQDCWCYALPALMPTELKLDCYCPACLIHMIAERIEQAIKSNGLERMLEIASEYRQPGELIEHIDYKIENGNYILSQWYHLKRGMCCHNGCIHCPY